MDIKLQQYYENRFEMMSTDGWRDLIEDIEGMLKAADTLDGATVDNLKFKQGEISIMRWILSLKEVSEKAYEELNENDA